jgi:hypothetical protein
MDSPFWNIPAVGQLTTNTVIANENVKNFPLRDAPVKYFWRGSVPVQLSTAHSMRMSNGSIRIRKIYVKVSLKQAVEAHRVMRRRGSNIFYTIGSQMAVRLPGLCDGCSLAPGIFLVLISVRG